MSCKWASPARTSRPRTCRRSGARPAIGLEAARLLRSPVWRGVGVPAGDGRPVLLIPGFLAGDGTLATMTKWLRANGYWTRRAGIRANVGCSQEACERIEERLEALADRTGQPVAIVGQSRGGVLARVVAAPAARPGVGDHHARRPHGRDAARAPAGAAPGRRGRRARHRPRARACSAMSCWRGACCEAFRADLIGDFPAGVGYVCVYSRSDGIVDWRACLDGAADEHVEIDASHCGMALSRGAYRVVARALAGFAGDEPLARAA